MNSRGWRRGASIHLQPRQELLRILMLPDIDGLAIVVLEGMPDADWLECLLAAQCQVCECGLHDVTYPQTVLLRKTEEIKGMVCQDPSRPWHLDTLLNAAAATCSKEALNSHLSRQSLALLGASTEIAASRSGSGDSGRAAITRTACCTPSKLCNSKAAAGHLCWPYTYGQQTGFAHGSMLRMSQGS